MGEELPKWIVGDEESVGRLRRVLIGCVLGLRRYGLAYLMLVASTSYVLMCRQVTVKMVAIRGLVPLLALKPIDAVVGRISLRLNWLRENGVSKLAAVLGVVVSLISFLVRR